MFPALLSRARHRSDERRTGPFRYTVGTIATFPACALPARRRHVEFIAVSSSRPIHRLMVISVESSFVSIADLTRAYRVGESEIQAVQDVSLEIARGEFLGIVGVSGSGKSTLLQLLGGLDSPTSGSIRVAGHALESMNRYERALYRRRTVGFVFQAFYLIPTLSAEANLCYALTFQGTYGSERKRRARAALARVGLEGRIQHRPSQLSGGEQQRVAVARALVHDPPLLLADEPTGNLDRKNAAALFALFRAIKRETRTTVVLVTHDEELSGEYCDRIVRMRDGRILDAEGQPC